MTTSVKKAGGWQPHDNTAFDDKYDSLFMEQLVERRFDEGKNYSLTKIFSQRFLLFLHVNSGQAESLGMFGFQPAQHILGPVKGQDITALMKETYFR